MDWGVVKDMKNRILIAAVGALGLLVAGGVSADWTWNFSGSNAPAGPYSASGTSTTVTASGWRNTTFSSDHTSSSYGAGNLVNVDSDGSGSTYLAYYSGNGLGVYDGGSPQHAVDNDGYIESILLAFTQPVTLSQVRFGWYGGGSLSGQGDDYDFTLAAYTASGNPTSGLTSLEYADLASNGWGLIESHFNNESHGWEGSDPVFSVNSGNTSSSYWLISALNPKLDPAHTSYAGWRDFFKLYSVSAKTPTTPPPGIPEPSTGSLLLLGLMLAGYVSSQKRQRAEAGLAA